MLYKLPPQSFRDYKDCSIWSECDTVLLSRVHFILKNFFARQRFARFLPDVYRIYCYLTIKRLWMQSATQLAVPNENQFKYIVTIDDTYVHVFEQIRKPWKQNCVQKRKIIILNNIFVNQVLQFFPRMIKGFRSFVDQE